MCAPAKPPTSTGDAADLLREHDGCRSAHARTSVELMLLVKSRIRDRRRCGCDARPARDVARHAIDAHRSALASRTTWPRSLTQRPHRRAAAPGTHVEGTALGRHRAPGGQHRGAVLRMHDVDPQLVVGEEVIGLAAEDVRAPSGPCRGGARSAARPTTARRAGEFDDAGRAVLARARAGLDFPSIAPRLGVASARSTAAGRRTRFDFST